ncbi:MAG: hypothetical protein JWP12_1398 [Bacteroidetes bacterium]|nr:hypothetical protein [Bacteroidota bacterium]
MAIPTNVINSINNFFSALSTISDYTSITSDGNKYELYIYSITYEALSRNFILTPQSLSASGDFVFKCSPGPINNNYSYF